MSNTRKLDKSTAYSDSTSIVPSVLIEGFETTAGVIGSTDASNITTSVQHIGVGSKSVSFDKSGTTEAFVTVEKTIPSIDLTDYSAHYSIEFQIYLSSVADVSTIQVSIGTDNANYISWKTDGEYLFAGWNTVYKGLNYPEIQVGNGINYSAATWVAITIIFNSSSNTLNGILVDNIELHSTETHSLEEIAIKSGDAWLDHAVEVIKSQYGQIVNVGLKNKDLVKFGRSNNVDNVTLTELQILPASIFEEVYLTSNLITHISSSSAADTVSMSIEGNTVDASGNFTFVSQVVTLAGQTKTALTTPLARCTRLRNNSKGMPPANGTRLVGPLYVYEDVAVVAGVPSVDAAVHCMIRVGQQNSEKAVTTVSSTDYWIITGAYADVLEKTGANVEVLVEIRQKSGVHIDQYTMSASEKSGAIRQVIPYAIAPPNSDIRLIALASSSATDVSGGIFGVLAKVI